MDAVQTSMSSDLDVSGLVSRLECTSVTGIAPQISPYNPLDPFKLEIRLLKICPPTIELGDIYCDQETISLESFPFYRALSYEWGKPDDTIPDSWVIVNNFEVKTTPNLRLALRHLECNAWYWIDPLCINQDDPSERGHQVGIMTKIYEKASAIDVWLGRHAQDSAVAFELINEFDSLNNLMDSLDRRPRRSLQERFGKGIELVKPKLMDASYTLRWVALRNLTLRTYWSRLWIIQEIVVSPFAERVQLLCGDSQTLLMNLHVLLKIIQTISYSIPSIEQTSTHSLVQSIKLAGRTVLSMCSHAIAWRATSMGKGNRTSTSLIRLLTEYRSHLCTDPRDKVYALLGVSIQYKDHELPTSYSISVEQVYRNTAKYVMESSDSLDVLLHCRRRGSKDGVIALPSWVPNWRYYDPYYKVIRDKLKGWKAAGSLPAITRVSSNGNVLSVRGFVVGEVSHVNTRYILSIGEMTSEENFANGISHLRQCLEYFIEALGKETVATEEMPTETILREFYKTIILTTYRRKACEFLWSFDKFRALCTSLYDAALGDIPYAAEWVISNLPQLCRNFRYRGLCRIALANKSPSAGQDVGLLDQELPRMTAGLCGSSTTVGDEVVVVRG